MKTILVKYRPTAGFLLLALLLSVGAAERDFSQGHARQ
jgi:hypothetical protein